jgi:integrase
VSVEQRGDAWRVRVRWRGLISISVSVASEKDGHDVEDALRQLKEAGRKDLLATISKEPDWLPEIVALLRTTKARAISLEALVKARQAAANTVGGAYAAWKTWCENGGENRRGTKYSASTLESYASAFTAFFSFLPSGKDTALEGITPAVLNAWRRHMTGAEKRTAQLANRHVMAVQALWTWMSDPAKGNYQNIQPLRLTQLAEPKGDRRARNKSEIERVLALVSPEKWRAPLSLLMETGMRDSELRFLRWQDVDLVRRAFVLVSHEGRLMKTTSSERLVPMTAEALAVIEVLKEAAGDNPKGYVFPDATLNRYTLSQAWRRAYKKAGVHIREHDLRHSFAVRLLQGGADVATTRDVLGHSSISTTDRYAREIDQSKKLERARQAAEVAPVLPQASFSDPAKTP